MAVVDAYDTLTSDHPYRGRLASEEALDVLQNEAGKQFDPRLALAFIGMVEMGRLC
jgi:HD-GYP domain-containing protein (c-di-GMP phosphodiesterase class II)